MEHSASILDISSDDDVATKQRNAELERGKENIPPPDFLAAQQSRVHEANASVVLDEAKPEAEPVKRPRLRKLVQDAMDEDRRPLGDLVPSEFYGEGCDAASYVTVDVGIEKPSGLSREVDCTEEEAIDEKVEEVVERAEEIVAKKIEEVVAEKVEQVVAQENVAPVEAVES